ncbi:MAG: hypothetical protein FOGNACKC_06190 [Anaerolineae bacterium]|nr:hypothetical protein [Anaerolineae bacterium]
MRDIQPGDRVKSTRQDFGKLKVFAVKSDKESAGNLLIDGRSYNPEQANAFFQVMRLSPALEFLAHFSAWNRVTGDNRRKGLRDQALTLAVDGQMRFDKTDFETLRRHTGIDLSDNELFYRSVVNSGNASALAALEHVFVRPVMWLPAMFTSDGKPERLALDKFFTWEGLSVRVTSFKKVDDAWQIVACHQEYVDGETKTRRVFKLTQADLNDREALNLRLQAAFAALPRSTIEWSYYRPGDGQFYCETCRQPGDRLKSAETVTNVCAQCGTAIRTDPTKDHLLAWLSMVEKAATVTPATVEPVRSRLLFEELALARRVLAVIDRVEATDVPESW